MGYRIETSGCVKDSNYDKEHTFVFRRDDSQVASGASALSDSTAGEPQQCGALDLDHYCSETYGNEFSSILMDPKGALDWRCTPALQRNNIESRGLNMQKACQTQYGYGATARVGDMNDGYSWCCDLPPTTPIRVHLRRINVYGNGDGAGRGNIELSFKVILAARYCTGRSVIRDYLVCDEWDHTVQRKIADNRPWAIRYTTPAIGMPAYSYLFIEWMVTEDDTFSRDDRCGRFLSQDPWAGEETEFERPILYWLGLAEDLEEEVFRYQTLETPVIFPTGLPVPTEEYYSVAVRQQHFDPETGELGPMSENHYSDERLYCQDGRFTWIPFYQDESLPLFFGGLLLGIDLMVFPNAVPRQLLFGTSGDVPDEPELISPDEPEPIPND